MWIYEWDGRRREADLPGGIRLLVQGWSREFSQHVIENANLNGTYREKKISVEQKVQITRQTFEGTLKAAKVSGTSFLGPRPFHLYISFFSGSS